VRQVRRTLNDPILLWLLLALPAAIMLQGYLTGTLFYGELMHASGEIGARLLIIALAITPLRLLFPQASWLLWLAARRRYFGVAAFGRAGSDWRSWCRSR
jgi:sulfoxide reductase heme-binding subunit YedZ